MKTEWIRKFDKASEKKKISSKVLVGFNANLDITKSLSDLDINLDKVDGEERRSISSEKDYLRCLKYLDEEGANFEVSLQGFDPKLSGEANIGGQAGIVGNFLSRIGGRSILYTPFLSKELAEEIDSDVLYPVVEENLMFKQVSEATNTDRTKKNYIIENEDKSSRLILSNSIRGFGAYFRKGIEDKFPELQKETEKAIFSGFHDIEGNYESKLRKAEKQMRKLHLPKHLEFVSTTEERDKMILERIIPNFTSVGMDDSELQRVGELLELDIDDEASLGNVFMVSKKLIQNHGVKRVHVHTKNFQAVITDGSYPITVEQMRESLLFAGVTAASMAGNGKIPDQEEIELNTENMHLSRLDDLEHFQDFFDLEKFAESGTARIEGYKVVAVPTVIHEEPERLVGLGDVMSSAAFITESY